MLSKPQETGVGDAVAQRDHVARALGAIAPDQAVVLVLRLHEGYRCDEIAGMLQLTTRAVEGRLARAPELRRGVSAHRPRIGAMSHVDGLLACETDRQLSERGRERVGAHLRGCARCRDLHDELQRNVVDNRQIKECQLDDGREVPLALAQLTGRTD